MEIDEAKVKKKKKHGNRMSGNRREDKLFENKITGTKCTVFYFPNVYTTPDVILYSLNLMNQSRIYLGVYHFV